MIWLVDASAAKASGECSNSGMTPPITIWSPITPATAP
jgi:hypothetical protein